MIDKSAADEWPDSANWWLTIYSEQNSEHPDFDRIEISVKTEDFKKVITSVMVPKIDGIVRESHNFISYLIHKNTEALQKRCAELEAELAEAVRFITIAKRKFAPNTTNSLVDDFLSKHDKEKK